MQIEQSGNRYIGKIDGAAVGYLEFEDLAETRAFTHTVVYPEFQGNGYAAELVAFGLADTKANGLDVKAVCSYVVDYLIKHPATS